VPVRRCVFAHARALTTPADPRTPRWGLPVQPLSLSRLPVAAARLLARFDRRLWLLTSPISSGRSEPHRPVQAGSWARPEIEYWGQSPMFSEHQQTSAGRGAPGRCH
jgi:hypothetical protein